MPWSVIRLIFKTSSVTPDFFYAFHQFYHFLPAVKVLKKSVHRNFWARTSLIETQLIKFAFQSMPLINEVKLIETKNKNKFTLGEVIQFIYFTV